MSNMKTRQRGQCGFFCCLKHAAKFWGGDTDFDNGKGVLVWRESMLCNKSYSYCDSRMYCGISPSRICLTPASSPPLPTRSMNEGHAGKRWLPAVITFLLLERISFSIWSESVMTLTQEYIGICILSILDDLEGERCHQRHWHFCLITSAFRMELMISVWLCSSECSMWNSALRVRN